MVKKQTKLFALPEFLVGSFRRITLVFLKIGEILAIRKNLASF